MFRTRHMRMPKRERVFLAGEERRARGKDLAKYKSRSRIIGVWRLSTGKGVNCMFILTIFTLPYSVHRTMGVYCVLRQ